MAVLSSKGQLCSFSQITEKALESIFTEDILYKYRMALLCTSLSFSPLPCLVEQVAVQQDVASPEPGAFPAAVHR